MITLTKYFYYSMQIEIPHCSVCSRNAYIAMVHKFSILQNKIGNHKYTSLFFLLKSCLTMYPISSGNAFLFKGQHERRIRLGSNLF